MAEHILSPIEKVISIAYPLNLQDISLLFFEREPTKAVCLFNGNE